MPPRAPGYTPRSVSLRIPPPPPAPAPVVPANNHLLLLLLPPIAFAECFVVSFGLKNDHGHPHTHEERFLWQTNVFFNLMLVYFALETISPGVHHLTRKLGRRVFVLGLHCDYLALWTMALTCTLPVEFYADAGDVTVDRAWMGVLYAGLALLLAVRIVAFIHDASS